MAIIRSIGSVQSITSPPTNWVSGNGSLNLYGASSQTYATIYSRQPNVRTVVDFLARNIAQLGIHAFRRVSDNDRERLSGHGIIGLLKNPNPATTRYRLVESLMQDMGIYFNGYWLKVRSEPRMGLLRLPPGQMSVAGGLIPTEYIWTNANGQKTHFAPSEIVHFGGFDPSNPLMGLSPLETLRRVLAEEAAAGEHRQSYWRNASRHEGVIERPVTAPKWTTEQKQSWREQWQSRFAGGANSGMVPVLEDGMTFKPTSFSPKDSEYLSARKLTREECAAAYHVPLPMVGILEHATFSNIREQHKQLYQDCLGPWLVMLEEEIERQLLPEFGDMSNVYLEFNIAEKMKGSFEEQATSLQALVGRPIMTANEGRARINLPRSQQPDADELAAQQGGPASGEPAKAQPQESGESVAAVLQSARARQMSALLKIDAGDRPDAFVAKIDRWNRELASDLTPFVGAECAESYALVANGQMLTTLKSEANIA